MLPDATAFRVTRMTMKLVIRLVIDDVREFTCSTYQLTNTYQLLSQGTHSQKNQTSVAVDCTNLGLQHTPQASLTKQSNCTRILPHANRTKHATPKYNMQSTKTYMQHIDSTPYF